MKIKNKGKVYPSPSSSSSAAVASSPVNGDDSLSVLKKLLPATILVLVSVLSVEDREVLAYLITKSLKTTTTTTTSSSAVATAGAGKSLSPGVSASSSSSSSSRVLDSKNKKKKSGKKGETTHKPPVFDCDCFDCYTCYWLRWDSSPNRELIHQVIEAFEDHLTSGEASASHQKSNKRNNGRGKKKDKSGRRIVDGDNPKPVGLPVQPDESLVGETTSEQPDRPEGVAVVSGDGLPPDEGHVSTAKSPERLSAAEVTEREEVEGSVEGGSAEDSETVVPTAPAETGHKGLARKVLPDVLGLFNSRLWSLWNPNA